MAEMQKREAVAMQHVQAATCGSVNANNNKNSWAGMMQAPLLKTEYQEGSGLGAAGFRCDQVTERGGYTGKGGEAATTVVAAIGSQGDDEESLIWRDCQMKTWTRRMMKRRSCQVKLLLESR
jgi:hypothetical protein